MGKITMYGALWCIDCRRSKKLMDELGIDYEYINLDEQPEAAEIVEQLNDGLQSIPTIIFPDGRKLVEPSSEELLSALKSTS